MRPERGNRRGMRKIHDANIKLVKKEICQAATPERSTRRSASRPYWRLLQKAEKGEKNKKSQKEDEESLSRSRPDN